MTSLPTFNDLLEAFTNILFKNVSNSQMVEVTLLLPRRIPSAYRHAAPHALIERLIASITNPAFELGNFPERPAADIAYPTTSAGEVERKRDLDISALADCYKHATSAMKQALYQFVPVDIQDLLEIDGTLDRQTVHGIMTILIARYGADIAANQHTYLHLLQAPYNPRAQTLTAYLATARHTRATLALLGQVLAESLFVEMISAAITAGDPQYASTVESYLTASPDRSLDRLERVLSNRSNILAMVSSAAHSAQAVSPASVPAPPPPALALAAPAVPPPDSSRGSSATSRGRDRGDRRRDRGRKNSRGRAGDPATSERPDTNNLDRLAAQLQRRLGIYSHPPSAMYPHGNFRGGPPPASAPASTCPSLQPHGI
jgi:hypothetical protein